jgi:uncharacterized protein (TIGR00299 family) protein
LIAYLDCVGGLAGDMLIAALLDAGAPEESLRELPARLGVDEELELRVEPVQRQAIGALQLHVDANSGEHPHRSWRSIREQLDAARLESAVRSRAIAVFGRLAEVEGAIHGVAPEQVHFHELGSIDTLIDVVGAVTLLAELGVQRLVCSPLPLAGGVISAAHGMLPLPAPATVALLVGAPVFGVEGERELVTPTGAALASTLADAWGPIPEMTIERVGYGAGAADFSERPNVVRVMLGHEGGEKHAVSLLETNLDDINPQLIPDAAERCFAAGALEVWTTPVVMKKGRPAFVLSALARPDREPDVARAILEQTTALGVRVARLERYELQREQRTVSIEGGEVRVKLGRLDGRIVNVAPEHADCVVVAEATGTPVKSVWAAALAAARGLA